MSVRSRSIVLSANFIDEGMSGLYTRENTVDDDGVLLAPFIVVVESIISDNANMIDCRFIILLCCFLLIKFLTTLCIIEPMNQFRGSMMHNLYNEVKDTKKIRYHKLI